MSTEVTTERSVEEITLELKAAQKRDHERSVRIKESTPVVMQYTAFPYQGRMHDEIWDDSIVTYRVEGKCLNLAEAEAAGHRVDTGGMNYLFNTVTGKVVMATGGGHLYLHGWRDGDNSKRSMKRLGRYLVEHPEGGVVDHLVEQFKAERQS